VGLAPQQQLELSTEWLTGPDSSLFNVENRSRPDLMLSRDFGSERAGVSGEGPAEFVDFGTCNSATPGGHGATPFVRSHAPFIAQAPGS
jgi:hypothetical protein